MSFRTLRKRRREDQMAAEVAAREVGGDPPSSTLARGLLEGGDKAGIYLKSEESDDLVILSSGMLK